MPGTKDSGRPGGNPDLEQHQYERRYSWDEPCTAQFNIRMPPSLLSDLKQIEGYQELVRGAIAQVVANHKKDPPVYNPEDLIV